MEVEPVVGPDGTTIDLNLIPQVVEFEGFINYGSPIRTVNPALLGFAPSTLLGTTTQAITLTDNVINQPIFSTRKGNDERPSLERTNRRARRVDARGCSES